MLLNPKDLSPPKIYQLMISFITPRPIAWVSTVSADGVTNLAPFSFFNGVTSNPPTVMFCPVNNRHGEAKDTMRNIEAVPEFVVNIVPFSLAEPMNNTSALLPYGESEFDAFNITSEPSEHIRPPRVAEAPVCLECKLHQVVRIGDGPLAANVVFGEILLIRIRDEVLNEAGQIDPVKLDTIGRMGGEDYCRTTERFSIPRPDRRPAATGPSPAN
jgi:flavin reductase (DIM6/NTAB) family NADH-FMN oxidoreductase RutF